MHLTDWHHHLSDNHPLNEAELGRAAQFLRKTANPMVYGNKSRADSDCRFADGARGVFGPKTACRRLYKLRAQKRMMFFCSLFSDVNYEWKTTALAYLLPNSCEFKVRATKQRKKENNDIERKKKRGQRTAIFCALCVTPD